MRTKQNIGTLLASAGVLLSIVCVLGTPAAKVAAAPRMHQVVRPNLTGRVLDTSGKGVNGARVSIYEAGVKQGSSPFCPSCYPDCAKSAHADAQGKFRITSLDPQLRFRLLIVADGYEPTYAEHIEPAAGLIRILLKPRHIDLSDTAHIVRGQVLDSAGLPVSGALVEPCSVITPQSEMFAPASDLGVDPLAISDGQGRFAFYSQKPNATFRATVKARGMATLVTDQLSAGQGPHTLKMGTGASISGRIVRAGKPVAGIPVGLVQVDKDARTFVGNLEIGTDSQGGFLLTNITPNTDYYVYGIMGNEGKTAATIARRIHVGTNGTAINVRDIAVSPLHHLTGRILLTDGKTIPPMTRILISRQGAWDSKTVMADAQGRFTADALPDETLDIAAGVRNYQFADGNVGIDSLADDPQNGSYYRRTLHVLPSVTTITLKLEPSKAP